MEAVGSGRYKIGWSDDVGVRVRQLQTGCPFEIRVLNVIEGDQSGETWLHRRFAQYRVCGEWFELPQAPLEFLVSLRPSAVETKAYGRINQ
jgi:hypothetical protein